MVQAFRFYREICGSGARTPSCEPKRRWKAHVFGALLLIRQHGSKLGIGSTIRIFQPARFESNQSQSQQRKNCNAGGKSFESGASTWTSLMPSDGIGCVFKVRNFDMLRIFLQALFRARNQWRARKRLWRACKDCRTPLGTSTTLWFMKGYRNGSLTETMQPTKGATDAPEKRSRLAGYPVVSRPVSHLPGRR